MDKKIILITGMFTAGKSTIADNIVTNNNVIVIPQATTRGKREDDTPEFFKYFSKEDYEKLNFFSCFGNYGILQDDITNFFGGKNNNAVSIVSTPDIEEFLKKIPRENLFLILKTLSTTLKEEKKMIINRFPNFFKGDSLNQRINLAIELATDYYFNPSYSSNFDLILPLNAEDKTFDVNGIHFSTKVDDGSIKKRGKELCMKY